MFTHRVRGGPAGGGFSTVEDLHRFARAVLTNRLLDAEHTELWMTGKVEAFRGQLTYGYPCGHHSERGVEWHGHNGGHLGISASLAFFPREGYVVAVLSNYDRAAGRVADYARQMILGAHGAPPAASPNPYSLGVMLAAEPDGLTIDGEAVGHEPMALLRPALQKPEPIRFGIERNGAKIEITVTPRKAGTARAAPARATKRTSPLIGTWQMTTQSAARTSPRR